MSTFEIHGGPITHRHLMNKTKHDLARMVMEGLKREERGATAKETIVAAAIRIPTPPYFRQQTWNGKPLYPEYLIITSPPPARHPTLLHPWRAAVGEPIEPPDQGFLTSTGRYVDRKEALAIVRAAGQPQIDHPSKNAAGQLFSEDLW